MVRPFSFRSFLGSVNIDIESLGVMLDSIIEFIDKMRRKLSGDCVLLVVLSVYEGPWEYRLWLFRERSVLLSIPPGEEGEPYKVVVEAFCVPREAALIDIELYRSERLDIVELEEPVRDVLARILEVFAPPEQDREEANVHVAPAQEAPVSPQTAEDPLEYCASTAASVCSVEVCRDLKRDPLSVLDTLGILLLGRESEYACILRSSEESCPYRILHVPGEGWKCADRAAVEETVARLAGEGYDIAIPLGRTLRRLVE